MLSLNNNPNHISVDPLPGAAPWVGGKRNLAREIIPRIEAIPHACYAEPFIGMGGVFLRRRKRPEVEVINDRARDVATFFRVLQRHPDALLAELALSVTSRVEFERLRRLDPETLTDLERAARFIYLQYCAYGGKPVNPTFGISPLRPSRFDAIKLEGVLRKLHRRLSSAYIECLDFETFLARWDRPSTLFYLDPPYWHCEGYYGKGLFERADFERLATALKGLRGRFLMSLNDLPEVRETFAAFEFETVETTYRVNGVKRVTEVIISG
ncbi:MAG: DNA adenine methylase [Magnetospirillum sp.]|nr:MAG: DNA adenine methylase [Magnetospirillum sp.]